MATKGNTTGGAEVRFEESLTELEGVVRRLEQGELPLEDSLVAFERGMALVKQLSKRLEDIERRVEELDEPGVTADQAAIEVFHGLYRAIAVPAPDRTDQLCEMESIWHSGLVAEPSGVPSSK